MPGDRNYLIEYRDKENGSFKYYYYDYKEKKVKGEEENKNACSKDLKTKPQ